MGSGRYECWNKHSHPAYLYILECAAAAVWCTAEEDLSCKLMRLFSFRRSKTEENHQGAKDSLYKTMETSWFINAAISVQTEVVNNSNDNFKY